MILKPTTKDLLRFGKNQVADVVGPSGLPWGGGQGGHVVPNPILYAEGDDATWSTNDLATWPSRVGPNAALVGGMGTPQKAAALLNGHQGVQFRQASFDQLGFGSVKATASDYTFQIVMTDTAATAASGTRQYIWRSFAVVDTDDLAVAHISNLGAFYERGYFDAAAGADATPGSGWHYFRTTNWLGNSSIAPATTRAVVLTFVLKNGSCAVYEDGVLRGVNTISYTQRRLTDLVLSGTKASGIAATQLDATVYAHRIWDRALDATDVVWTSNQMLARFGLTAYALPAAIQSIFGSSLVYLADLDSLFHVDYVAASRALNGWANILDTATHAATVSTATGTYEAAAVGGRGAAQWTASNRGYKAHTLATHFTGVPSSARHMLAVAKNLGGGGQGSTDGIVMCAGSSTTDGGERLSLRGAVAGSPADPSVISRRRDDAGTNRIATGGDPAQLVHALIGSQAESPDSGIVEMDGTQTPDATPDNCGTATLDRFSWGHKYRTGDALTEVTAFHAMGVSAVVVGAITAQQRADFRTACQLHRSAT